MAVAAGAVLVPRGLVRGTAGFAGAGNDMGLGLRDLKAHLREGGESNGYNASFSRADRSRFLQELAMAVQRSRKRTPPPQPPSA